MAKSRILPEDEWRAYLEGTHRNIHRAHRVLGKFPTDPRCRMCSIPFAGAGGWVARHLSDDVYVTIDLDAFDPSAMSAVGTPEPGGLHWDEVSDLLIAVTKEKRVVGFDVTELSPSLGPPACAQLAARLTYRLIGLALGPLE